MPELLDEEDTETIADDESGEDGSMGIPMDEMQASEPGTLATAEGSPQASAPTIASADTSQKPGDPLLPPPVIPVIPQIAGKLALDWQGTYNGMTPEQQKVIDASVNNPRDPEGEKKRFVNSGWIFERTGVFPDSPNAYIAARHGFAALHGWGDDAARDDSKFYTKVTATAKADKDFTEQVYGIEGDTQEAAKAREDSAWNKGYATGTGVFKETALQGFDRWTATHPKADKNRRGEAWAAFQQGHTQGKADDLAGRQAANAMYPILFNPDENNLADALPYFRALTPNQKSIALTQMQARAEEDEKGRKKGITMAVGQSAVRGTQDLLKSIAEYAGPEDLSANFKEGDPAFGETMAAKGPGAAAVEARTAIQGALSSGGIGMVGKETVALTKEQAMQANTEVAARRNDKKDLYLLKNFAEGTIDPIQTNHWYGDAAAHLAQAAPMLALAAAPGGLVAVSMALTEDAKNALEARGVSEEKAAAYAPFIGSVQGLMFRLNATFLSKAPGIAQILGKYPTSAIVRTIDRAGIGAIEAGLNMGAQAALPDITMKIASEFDHSVPGQSWEEINKEFWASTAQGVIDFAPIVWLGTGFANARDIKGADALVAQPEKLLKLGFDQAHVDLVESAKLDIGKGKRPYGAAVEVLQGIWNQRVPIFKGDARANSIGEAAGIAFAHEGGVPAANASMQIPEANLHTPEPSGNPGELPPATFESWTDATAEPYQLPEEQEAAAEAAKQQEAAAVGVTMTRDDDGWHVQDEEKPPVLVSDDPAAAIQARDQLVEEKHAEEEKKSAAAIEDSNQPEGGDSIEEKENATGETPGGEAVTKGAGDTGVPSASKHSGIVESHLSDAVKRANDRLESLNDEENPPSKREIEDANTEAISEITDKFPLPEGWKYARGGEWSPSGSGVSMGGKPTSSWYAKIESGDRTLKLRIADHENRSSKHEAPDIEEMVKPGQVWDPENVASALRKISERIAAKDRESNPSDWTGATAEPETARALSTAKRAMGIETPEEAAAVEKIDEPTRAAMDKDYGRAALIAEYRAIQDEMRARGEFDAVAKLEAKGQAKFYGKTGKLVERRNQIRKELGGEDALNEGLRFYSGLDLGPLIRFFKNIKNRTMSDLDRATVAMQAKLQKSIHEANRAVHEITKTVPEVARREAITIWAEHAGDKTELAAVAAGKGKGKKDATIRRAAKLAQKLTPAEIVIAKRVRRALDIMFDRGVRHGTIDPANHRKNYIPHIFDQEEASDVRPPGFGSRPLKDKLRFNRHGLFQTYAEAADAGYDATTLDIARLLPTYIHESNTVIAHKQFIRDIHGKYSSEGTPLLIPRGTGRPVDKPEGGRVYLLNPRGQKEAEDIHGNPVDQRKYKVNVDQPALSDWTFQTSDTEGNPIFMKDDLALHPELQRRVHAIMGTSKLRNWYNNREGNANATKALKLMVKAVDVANAVAKREMFGFFSFFHHVQEARHAMGHGLWNPVTGWERPDMSKADHMDFARHGLQILGDRTAPGNYLEGVEGGQSSFIAQAARKFGGKAGRVLADVMDAHSRFLFEAYIPGLKIATARKILGRNMRLYADEMARGDLTESDVKLISMEQANAAFGHLNYALLDRSPTTRHLASLALLAPDFAEARVRFVAQAFQGLVGAKRGREQLKALALLALQGSSASWLWAQLTGGEWDPKHPFEFTHGGRRFATRSVPEDMLRLFADIHEALPAWMGGESGTSIPFIRNRFSPFASKLLIQANAGTNYRGEKVSLGDTFAELLASYIPITLRSLPGLRDLTATGQNHPVSTLEELAGSLGLHISRYSPVSETYKTAHAWMKAQGMEVSNEVHPVSKFQQLKYALEDGDLDHAQKEYDKLAKAKDANAAKLALGFTESVQHAFTKDRRTDAQFRADLRGKEALLYDRAMEVKKGLLDKFAALKR